MTGAATRGNQMRFTKRFRQLPNWIRSLFSWKLGLAAAIAGALLLGPARARAQFGLDPCCAIISAGLNTVSGLLRNLVAAPLSALQQLRQQQAEFEQQVVYPVAAISRARQEAAELDAQVRQIAELYRLPRHSASLASPRKLEQALLSSDPQVIATISERYASVYGPVMAAGDAPPAIRDLVDMSDAEAQAAMKKAIEIDALADIELTTADSIHQQLVNAAPGSAAILEVEAAAWVIRANAYTQSALAELARVRSTELAEAGAQLKFAAADLDRMRSHASDALRHGAH